MSRSLGATRASLVLGIGAMVTWAVACSDSSGVADSADAGAGDAADAAPESEGLTSVEGGTDGGIDCTPDSGAPEHLSCTGLYADWASKTIAVADGVLEYEPGYRLWSDGAQKRRFIRLPPGTKIDTSNMDEWTFPVGTRIWKEFSLGGKRIETRLLEKHGTRDWKRTTYRWNADESAAFELRTGEIGVDGTKYEIPQIAHCNICHNGRVDGVLGFDAISLSSPDAKGLTMQELVARDLVTTAPSSAVVVPGSSPVAAALGYLHANCGNPCHSKSDYANAIYTGLYMRLTVANLATPEDTDTYKTTIGVTSTFQTMTADGGALQRVAPKDPEHSAIYVRAGTRDDALKIQMPPLITHEVDPDGLATLRTWIEGL